MNMNEHKKTKKVNRRKDFQMHSKSPWILILEGKDPIEKQVGPFGPFIKLIVNKKRFTRILSFE